MQRSRFLFTFLKITALTCRPVNSYNPSMEQCKILLKLSGKVRKPPVKVMMIFAVFADVVPQFLAEECSICLAHNSQH